MNYLSLCSGIGGLDLGLDRAGMTCVGQVEIDPFCQKILAKHWPEVARHHDVRTVTEWWRGDPARPPVDLIAAGFPCQDISPAGRRAGITGARSGLWSAVRNAVRDLRPDWVLLENVSAILVRGLDVVAADLAEVGYDLEWDCIPAAAVGAPHRRDRWFGVAYPEDVADAEGVGVRPGLREGRTPRLRWGRPRDRRGPGDPWADEPGVGGAADGVPAGLDRAGWERGVPRVTRECPVRAKRLHGLGNAVVPQVAEHLGRMILRARLDDALAAT